MEIVLIWFLFGLVAAIIANSKGRGVFGWFVLGILLGPFALVIAFLPSIKKKTIETAQLNGEAGHFKKCPYCAEVIRKEAVKCRFCGSDLPPPEVEAINEDYKNTFAYKAGKTLRKMVK